MKNYIYILIAAIAGMVASCDDVHTYNNGELEGYWRLDKVDTLATGGVKDLSNNLLFWSIQSKILQVTDHEGKYATTNMIQEQDGNTLHIHDPYTHGWHEDELVTDPERLRPYGINATNEDFVIEMVNGGDMVLRSETLRLNFVKY